MSAQRDSERGGLAIVLHAHMPYVEGFGTWPFGEEWLWEAVATVYLPLLEVLRGERVTIGLTPVLCDQLELLAEDETARRLRSFLRDVRGAVHAEDADGLVRGGEPALAAEVRRAAGDYSGADLRLEAVGGDLIGAFAELTAGESGAELWAGPATHPVLPLLATDAARGLQLASGLASHRRRFGGFGGGLWLPECAYVAGLERDLADLGVRAFCVDQTAARGLGSLDHLEPVATPAGPVAVPLDWTAVGLVWDPVGYPSHPAYRDGHRRTLHDLMPWANDGRAYDPERAGAAAQDHAREFVRHVAARLDAYRGERGRAGLLCCALDAELLGHWWYEGPRWLGAVLAEAPRQGVELVTLPRALDRFEPVERDLAPSTWGTTKDLSTWDNPGVADLAFRARGAELRLASAARRPGPRPALERAARELLALQSSDWAFMASRELAGDYPRERVRGHAEALDRARAALEDSAASSPSSALRNLVPDLELGPLLAA